MFQSEFSKNYFALFDLKKRFSIDEANLAERYRFLQRQSHPDMHGALDSSGKRGALQYSGLINQAYSTLRSSSKRALYLLDLEGFSNQEVAKLGVKEEFLMEQIQLREQLEDLDSQNGPLGLLEDVSTKLAKLQDRAETEFADFYQKQDFARAACSANCLQYLFKIREELDCLELKVLEEN